MKSSKEIKVLILAGRGESTSVVYHYLKDIFPDLMVIQEEKPNRWKFIKNRAKRIGWLRVVGQVIFQLSIPSVLKITHSKRKNHLVEKYQLSLGGLPSHKVIRVNNVNGPDSMGHIKNSNADVVLLNGTRIISKKILNQISVPVINTHLGITPMYRGVHGGYWSLVNKDHKNFGSTIHLVDSGVDTGGILSQVYMAPRSSDSFTTYPLLQLAETLPELSKILLKAANKQLDTKNKIDAKSKLWSHPTIFEYFYNRLRFGVK